MNKANISDTKAPVLELHLSVVNGFVSSKLYDKHDDFDFDIVNFPFVDGNVPRHASYGVYISQVIRFARICNHVTNFKINVQRQNFSNRAIGTINFEKKFQILPVHHPWYRIFFSFGPLRSVRVF